VHCPTLLVACLHARRIRPLSMFLPMLCEMGHSIVDSIALKRKGSHVRRRMRVDKCMQGKYVFGDADYCFTRCKFVPSDMQMQSKSPQTRVVQPSLRTAPATMAASSSISRVSTTTLPNSHRIRRPKSSTGFRGVRLRLYGSYVPEVMTDDQCCWLDTFASLCRIVDVRPAVVGAKFS
jgi:hypothetical protein